MFHGDPDLERVVPIGAAYFQFRRVLEDETKT